MDDKNFILTFLLKTPENPAAVLYVAFTYPYTYTELQHMLTTLDNRSEKYKTLYKETGGLDIIYYHRECVCYSLDRRRVDLITISSHHGITWDREVRLKDLFPESDVPRAFKFTGKKVIFVSARVHPGETPSSFVFNGFLNFLLQPDDPIAVVLRKKYVFKLIPTLNPDGIARGHYRTDTRGINLNRVYLNPSLIFHPSVYAARALIRYYHHGEELEDVIEPEDYSSQENQGYADLSSDVSSPDLSASRTSQDLSSSPLKSASDVSVGPIQIKVSSDSFDEENETKDENKPLVGEKLCPGPSEEAETSVSRDALKEKNVDKCLQCNRFFCEISGEHRCAKHESAIEQKSEIHLKPMGERGENAEIFDESTRFSFTSPSVSDSTLLSVAPRKWSGGTSSLDTWNIGADSDCSSSADCFSKQFISLHDSEDGVGTHFVSERSRSLPAKSGTKIEVAKDSGLYLYVDLHGHASKKGKKLNLFYFR